MFVQVIKGKTNNPDAMRALGDKWQAELRPGAAGYVGSTFGATADGNFVTIVQFEDEAAAKDNSNRPEQDAFFKELSQYIDGEPTFLESTDTHLLLDGPSAKAGFVQIMEGTVPDRAKAEAAESPEMLEQLRTARPDLLGALRAWFQGNDYLEVAYFTSEAEARKGEKQAEFEPTVDEMAALFGTPTYTDLPNPQIHVA